MSIFGKRIIPRVLTYVINTIFLEHGISFERNYTGVKKVQNFEISLERKFIEMKQANKCNKFDLC